MATGYTLAVNETLENQLYKLLAHAYRCQEAYKLYEKMPDPIKSNINGIDNGAFIAKLRLASDLVIDARNDLSANTLTFLITFPVAFGIKDSEPILSQYNENEVIDGSNIKYDKMVADLLT